MIKLSVPSKTFLLGEYVALDGGPSIVISTAPRFELRVGQNRAGQIRAEVHPESPAGILLESDRVFFSKYRFEFIDPYDGQGGFGASSAHWALLYAFRKYKMESSLAWSWTDVLTDYRKCAWNGQGRAPSGADVVSHLHGGFTWFNGAENRTENLKWGFADLSFSLWHTGQKLPTHEYLRAEAGVSEDSLRGFVEEAKTAFKVNDEQRLARSITGFAEALDSMGRVAKHTKNILNSLSSVAKQGSKQVSKLSPEEILVAKGCGAMGSDVVVVLHRPNRLDELKKWAQSERLKLCGTLEDVGAGLLIEEGKE